MVIVLVNYRRNHFSFSYSYYWTEKSHTTV